MRAHVRTREREIYFAREKQKENLQKKNLQKESSSCRLKLKALAFHALINHSLVFILVFYFEHHH